MKTETCIYCGAELPEQTETREGNWWVNHDWRAEREIHNEDCEWVETHAHTLCDRLGTNDRTPYVL